MPEELYIDCPIVYSLSVIGKKWRVPIICELNLNQVMRYGELKKKLSGITNMMLSQTLKELEAQGLIQRLQYNEIPPRVEYSLTTLGRQLLPSLYSMAYWGIQRMEDCGVGCTKDHCCHHKYVPQTEEQDVVWFHQRCDREYQRVYEEVLQGADYAQHSAKQKLAAFIRYMLKIVTNDYGYFFNAAMAFALTTDKINVLDKQRPHYRILQELIAAARQEGAIRSLLSDEIIVEGISKFTSGLITEWEFGKGSYDIEADNAALIEWFVESL